MGTKQDGERRRVDPRQQAERYGKLEAKTALKLPGGMSFFNPKKEGTYRISILPFTAGKGNPGADEGYETYDRIYYAHRRIGPDEAAYICPRMTSKKPCPICEEYKRVARDPDATKDEKQALKPQTRQLFNVFDHDNADEGVQLFDFSYANFGKLLKKKVEFADEEEEDAATWFYDLERGYILRVQFGEDKFEKTTFMKAFSIEFRKRKNAIDEEIAKGAICLDELIHELPYKELKDIFMGTPDEDDEGPEDEDDKPTRARSSSDKPSRRKDEDEDDDDEDEDKKPSSKKEDKKPSRKDEDDEDDEEEKKPSRSKKDDDDEDDDDKEETKKPLTAEKAGIKVGSIVKHKKHGECEVMHISKDGTSLRLEDDEGEEHRSIAVDEVTLKKSKTEEKASSKKDEDDDNDDEDDD